MFIAITGAKGSGKDTFALPLIEEYGFHQIRQADPLKAMLKLMYEFAGVEAKVAEQKIDGDMKEVPCGVLMGKTPRHAMQTLGTDWRDMIHKELWSNIAYPRIKNLLLEGRPVVCTDIRFQHEANMVRDLGGTLIRVVRPGQKDEDTHVSETEMRRLKVDTAIFNNGTVDQLHQMARELVASYA